MVRRVRRGRGTTPAAAGPNQKKLPVPAEDQQQKAEAKIKDIYKDGICRGQIERGQAGPGVEAVRGGHGHVGRSDGEVRLVAAGRSTRPPRPDRWPRRRRRSTRSTKLYEVDAHALKADAVNVAVERACAGAGTTALARELAGTAMTLAEAAVAAERFDVASRLAKLANRATARVNDNQFKREMFERNREIERLKKRYAAIGETLKKVAANPADADANLAAGRWHCFVKGDWEKGLPMLAKGKDADLSAVAKQDLADPKDPKAQMASATPGGRCPIRSLPRARRPCKPEPCDGTTRRCPN